MDLHPQSRRQLADAEEMELNSTESTHSSEMAGDADGDWEQGDDQENPGASNDRPLPPHLKDISSLASWTVSTHKPGSGVQALRHPSPNYFWQSDGPQPHTLNIHFFKLVAIAHMRVYIDFELDESYTPIKMEFLAGTGHHDLQHVCDMLPNQPKGWLDVDLSNAGGPPALKEGEVIDDYPSEADPSDASSNDDDDDSSAGQSEEASRAARRAARRWRRIGTGPTLRCFLVQLRIIENHQNGKDTHLRGLQIFARDEAYVFGRRRVAARATLSRATSRTTASASASASPEALRSGEVAGGKVTGVTPKARAARRSRGTAAEGMREPDWMAELEMRLDGPELR